MNKRIFLTLCLGGAIGVCLAAPQHGHASQIVYDLSGVSEAPFTKHHVDYEFQINWAGAVLTHDLGTNPNSFFDDTITITGEIAGCLGAAGQSCFDDGAFITRDRTRLGAGTFRFNDVLFDLDGTQTNSTEDLYAGPDKNIGQLELITQSFGKNNRSGKITLGLKEHPELGYAFRLFDNNPTGDGNYQIFTWLVATGWFGSTRAESRPYEHVFNGEILACRRGGPACGGHEVPEPMTMSLLGFGLIGAARMRKRKTG